MTFASLLEYNSCCPVVGCALLLTGQGLVCYS